MKRRKATGPDEVPIESGSFIDASLLSAIYKICARIIQVRLAEGIDEHLQGTQYGFRKNRGVADALHYLRRIVERGEAMQGKSLMVLLDWEKAFGKVDQEQLVKAIERIGVPDKVVRVIAPHIEQPTIVCGDGWKMLKVVDA